MVKSIFTGGVSCFNYATTLETFIKSIVQCVGLGMYSITKTALLAMVKVLGSELASKGIRVNAINPGGFETGMLKKVCDNLISLADEK